MTELASEEETKLKAEFRAEVLHELAGREQSWRGVFRALQGDADLLAEVAAQIVGTLRRGGKVLVAGNGGSAAEAQHLAAELVGRFRQDRQPYPSISLTADSAVVTALGNDYGFEEVFARQIQGLGQPDDMFIAFSTSGRSENLVRATREANDLGIRTVAITGEKVSPLGEIAGTTLRAPSTDTAAIQEVHLLFTHVLCALAERELSRELA